MPVTSKSGRVFDLPSSEEEARIREGIVADPDTRELSDEEMAQLRPLGRPKAEVAKQAISIRLSPEVLTHFKAIGPGWQTRIDAVLGDYVNARH
ncbi:BrnA antitoxin family protein [Thiorhodococcus mannitoliphagus]|uniref:BrnA antitoxin family protein n=1 Tax=Thiorhodococcus mannitoliphagus TaxID=329406 RepID=A0A6P1E2H8_9GAMM|nr:BrnA antitoxin family protein [Thiorhodococcus mannitoliphagus]NEX23276.1 BrnA antitoxin family protein [Thiorhodococcus mannitoliphagus]